MGVRAGMNLAEARAVCPAGTVYVAPFDEQRSREALVKLAKWCWQFSPVAAVDAPPVGTGLYGDGVADGVLLDVTGASHLFGGEHVMLAEMGGRLQRMGFQARLAGGPTVGAAWAMARYGSAAMAVVGEERGIQNSEFGIQNGGEGGARFWVVLRSFFIWCSFLGGRRGRRLGLRGGVGRC
jgi:protein ImuB